MSDIAVQLLEAIDALLATETAAGGDLEDVSSYFVLYTASDTPPDYGTITPVLIVKMGTVSTGETTIPPCMTRKEYPVTFALFTENNGDTEDKTAAQILDLIENVFYNETFGLSQDVKVQSKDYSQSSIPPFSGDWTGSSEIIFNHVDSDVREIT